MIRVGIDIGSTTAKMAVVDETGDILFSKYERHNTKVREAVTDILRGAIEALGDVEASVRITGSVGMGTAELLEVPFVQEVVAAARAVWKNHPEASSMIDIGGEDAKIVFFKDGEATDLRMNGNCAGGTGAFIDQMAVLLGVNADELNGLALKATQTYPMASRCGVFSKTDIQNLIAKNVSRENIAASIFHAVAVQTVVTLAHGCDIHPPVLLCGGPLTFIPALREAFVKYLNIGSGDVIVPKHGTLLPALGTALSDVEQERPCKLSAVVRRLNDIRECPASRKAGLPPIFRDADDYEAWRKRISQNVIRRVPLKPGEQDAYVGIDSGSTTTKIVVMDADGQIAFSHYAGNGGNPVEAVNKGLSLLAEECQKHNAVLNIKGSCSTGYGEDLIKAAFNLDEGIVETMAHYMAARHLDKDVSFILDIGGQDMKAMFVNNGFMDRIEINEACSSGCGSFVETFAKTLGYTAQDFSQAACRSAAPCDLGTRCTVFMNSKVKQVLREGSTVEDIAAGLAYSVVKNCLYKVLKLKDTASLGRHIVVQGGTMRNDAVVRALEELTGATVTRCNVPELMGAFGCALHAREHAHAPASLDSLIAQSRYSTRLLHCKGCSNQCLVSCYNFDSGKKYYAGNRCEKVFSNGEGGQPGENVYALKNDLLFGRCADAEAKSPRLVVGIPRCLNMYEDFPFWHTLFTACNVSVCLSEKSDFRHYEQCARMVMSDNICFPAKLVHSHIQYLIEKGVDRIFMPFVIFEKSQKKEQNSYNCPVVTGYSEVIKSVQASGVPVDSPAISFKDRKLLYKQCREYLCGLGIEEPVVKKAFLQAEKEQEAYERGLKACNKSVLEKAEREGRFAVLLAGRPYHADPLIQHKISDMIAGMGVDVLTDDIVRGEDVEIKNAHFLSQWSYPNRILKAARWCAERGKNVQFIQLTSFGCGPDAFLVDEVRDQMLRSGKAFTQLKLDDINNVGSMKLRVRSLIEGLKLSCGRDGENHGSGLHDNAVPQAPDFKGCKILVPFFTPFISPLIPALMRVAGYDVETLPVSDVNSCEWGLKYANNEVCYPATLIVGDIVKALKSGRHDPAKTVIAMTQTGGQCRASNYLALIKKALADAGYASVPVISLSLGGDLEEGQPRLKMNWLKMIPIVLRALLYSDCIAKFYHASVVREAKPGEAARLRDLYLATAERLILESRTSELYGCIGTAARQFNEICRNMERPRVGVVGEIFLKFNPFAHKNITTWLAERGIEVVPSALTDFFMQAFVNKKARTETHIEKDAIPQFLYKWAYRLVSKQIDKVNRIAGQFRYFIPFNDIFAEAEEAKEIVSLNAQFGEGWLLPGEIVSYARNGINDVVSLQPFGCIANHIVSKGVEKRIKSLLPGMNLLSLDFDSGVSDVNITNRLLLFIDGVQKRCEKHRQAPAAPAERFTEKAVVNL